MKNKTIKPSENKLLQEKDRQLQEKDLRLQEKDLQLQEKDRQLQEKDLLTIEMNHRIKNNLGSIAAILQLQMRRTNSQEAKDAFQASIPRILAIAAVQDMFSRKNSETIALKEILGNVLHSALDNYQQADQNIFSEISGYESKIACSQAAPVALIANELIGNALKHGIGSEATGTIRINISERDNSITMTFFDSGRGDLIYDPGDESRLGLQIVKALSQEQLGGTFTISKENSETKAEIVFTK